MGEREFLWQEYVVADPSNFHQSALDLRAKLLEDAELTALGAEVSARSPLPDDEWIDEASSFILMEE